MNDAYPEGFATWPQERRDGYFGAQARDYRECESARSNGGAGAHDEKLAPKFKRVVNPGDWEHTAVPARKWIIPEVIPDEAVSLFFGDGATGKSLLAPTRRGESNRNGMARAFATGRANARPIRRGRLR